MTDSEIHNAAEVLLGPSRSCNFPNNGLLSEIDAVQEQEHQIDSLHNSLSSLEGTYLEVVASGATGSGKMSAVRRFFCCFVLFDLLLISLTWLICITIMNNNIIQIIKNQILNYSITNSLFDIVMASFSRFTILLLFYGFLQLNTTFFVALTTSTTCLFLIFKVIYYSWATTIQPAFHVILILMSFIVSWLETWYFDFRVKPFEHFAFNYAQTKERFSESINNLVFANNLRNPVMRHFIHNITTNVGETNESTGNFYSPLESPDGSDDESNNHRNPSKPSNGELLRQGKDTLEIAWRILNDRDWKLEKKNSNGDFIYSKHQKHVGKIFLLRTKIDVNAERLLKELFCNVDDFVTWNKTLLESRRILVIDDHTDVTYQVSSPGANGVISARDFVNLRHWDMKGDSFVLSGISVPYKSIPSNELYIRGENGPCCWVMRPSDGDTSNSCTFEFLLNTNLKGWIPQYVVETALTSVLLDYSACLKEHCQTLSRNLTGT